MVIALAVLALSVLAIAVRAAVLDNLARRRHVGTNVERAGEMGLLNELVKSPAERLCTKMFCDCKFKGPPPTGPRHTLAIVIFTCVPSVCQISMFAYVSA